MLQLGPKYCPTARRALTTCWPRARPTPGMLQLGPKYYPTARRALRFLLSQLSRFYEAGESFNSYAPHTMTVDHNLTKAVSLGTIDQTDDTFYLITAWGLYLNRTGDASMRADYYPLLKGYAGHYLGPGARSLGSGGTVHNPAKGGGVPYWNATLGLLWNPNLEHSRLGSFWSCYDTLTNSFAVAGLEALATAAAELGNTADADTWQGHRRAILGGLAASLSVPSPVPASLPEGGGTSGGANMYAELRGHENAFNEDKGEVGWSPLLWGMSYENIVPAVIGLTVIGRDKGNSNSSSSSSSKDNTPAATGDVTGDASLAGLGLDAGKLDATWAECAKKTGKTNPKRVRVVILDLVGSSTRTPHGGALYV